MKVILHRRGTAESASIIEVDVLLREIALILDEKAATRESLGILCRYAEFPELIMVYVWNLDQPVSRYFALNWAEAESIAQAMEWTTTPSWRGETTSPAGYGTGSHHESCVTC